MLYGLKLKPGIPVKLLTGKYAGQEPKPIEDVLGQEVRVGSRWYRVENVELAFTIGGANNPMKDPKLPDEPDVDLTEEVEVAIRSQFPTEEFPTLRYMVKTGVIQAAITENGLTFKMPEHIAEMLGKDTP